MSNIVSIILIVASVAAFFGYISPTYTNPTNGIEALTAQNEQYTEALDNSKAILSERDKLLATLNSFNQSDLNHLQTLLPDSVDSVRLIIELDSIAKNFGMTIRDFSAGTNTDTSQPQTLGVNTTPYGTYQLTFTTTASYQTFVAFLKALEQNLRLIDVTSVTFSAPTMSSVYDFTMTINTYWLK